MTGTELRSSAPDHGMSLRDQVIKLQVLLEMLSLSVFSDEIVWIFKKIGVVACSLCSAISFVISSS